MKPRVGRTPDILRKGHAHIPKTQKLLEDSRAVIKEMLEEWDKEAEEMDELYDGNEIDEWEDEDESEDLLSPALDTSVPATTKDESCKD